jgi:hypothetical protein
MEEITSLAHYQILLACPFHWLGPLACSASKSTFEITNSVETFWPDTLDGKLAHHKPST